MLALFLATRTEAYAELDVDADGKKKSNQKGIQCQYQLMNILFSDEFIEEFGCIGDVADRHNLDSGKASNNEQCWECA